MSQTPKAISKQPTLSPAEDFYRLRRDGIGFIEQMASNLWTDYNLHDPGITILEALCYAITDLAYRTGWDIKDLLAQKTPPAESKQPFPDQAFFTARNILTVNPTTPDDFRRLLIDLKEVRNAWIFPKDCACDVHYYAWCDKDKQLKLSYRKPDTSPNAKKVVPSGLYEVLLELEKDCDTKCVDEAIKNAKNTLLSHRNLSEDFFSIKIVHFEEVAVCADVEVRPDADIEQVQACIWFEIEQYFNPPIPFYTLQELMNAGSAVEDIFNGPELDSGFIKAGDLEAASLRTMLRTSDIINRLMDIEGVISVNQMLLTKYDSEGNVVKGAADPKWVNKQPEFEANKAGASWLLVISNRCQPRFYANASCFLFYKNGLPFRPRMDEAYDTLTQLRGEAERSKNALAAKDLPIPGGTFRNPQDYFPVQNSFPLTYGIGSNGLPAHASNLRRAQAKQLKAYLMVFEQMLGNALTQLSNTAELFSLDPEVKRTYFVKEFSKTLIQGFDEIENGLDKTTIEKLTETETEFLERRNRFLDHLMARFGEQFSEYALMLSNLDGKKIALDHLIDDKISFIKAYPKISRDRAKAFVYKHAPRAQGNIPGIKKRVSLILGFPDLRFVWPNKNHPIGEFQLIDSNENIWLEGDITPDVVSEGEDVAIEDKAYWMLIKRMTLADAYKMVKYAQKHHLHLKDEKGKDEKERLLADHRFDSKAEAQSMRDELLAWSANERSIVVEHLLLRPKFPGDALYPACSEGDCMTCGGETCGDEDPYSFRLTLVMPGWAGVYADNLDMRRFAERTIRQEIPSHLLGKICWVDNEGFIENPCDEVIGKLADLLIAEGLTADGTALVETEVCKCADAIYKAFSIAFKDWHKEKYLDYTHPDALNTMIAAQFSSVEKPSKICGGAVLDNSMWAQVQSVMVGHFQQIALRGWQFERFEKAWHLWLDANAKIDWTEERMHERVQAIINANLTAPMRESDVCQCATNILALSGEAFYQWMDGYLKAGIAPDENQRFELSSLDVKDQCTNLNFKSGSTQNKLIKDLLEDRYNAYKEVSYRLHIVVNLLSKLRNTYPGATLHDFDDGSDQNPVRLGSTALGNHRLKTSTP